MCRVKDMHNPDSNTVQESAARTGQPRVAQGRVGAAAEEPGAAARVSAGGIIFCAIQARCLQDEIFNRPFCRKPRQSYSFCRTPLSKDMSAFGPQPYQNASREAVLCGQLDASKNLARRAGT
jgi:hypothetical protein